MRSRIEIVAITASVLAFLAAAPAHALTLIDTGASTDNNGGVTLASYQWPAGRFSLTGTYQITDIYGWLGGFNREYATISVYADNASTVGAELYSMVWKPPDTCRPSSQNQNYSCDVGWYGLKNIDWLLTPGTYWVAFEVRDGQSFGGFMPVGGVPNPLEAFARWSSIDGSGGAFGGYRTTQSIGLQVYGNSVPEPGTLALLGLGLAGLGFAKRRKLN